MSRMKIHLSCIVSSDKKMPDVVFEDEDAQALSDLIDAEALGSNDIELVSFSRARTVSNFIDYHVKLTFEMPSNPFAINDVLGAPSRLNDGFHKLMKKQFGNYMLESAWQIDGATFGSATVRRPKPNTPKI